MGVGMMDVKPVKPVKQEEDSAAVGMMDAKPVKPVKQEEDSAATAASAPNYNQELWYCSRPRPASWPFPWGAWAKEGEEDEAWGYWGPGGWLRQLVADRAQRSSAGPAQSTPQCAGAVHL